ncbi:hypothetical protein [Lactiplantibacillus pentosus]|jgi:hypothetical protein|uniref:hypothetical protein n=1 Tax=Lactiplantibacillus pentosus TaxID=1589 RepID=UPI0021A75738|nr:hypothetical protein [Lactiplantibacillus pentosus]WFC03548.1 hypothetical protein PGN10_00940 [Lactiplantibacillus pentosus]
MENTVDLKQPNKSDTRVETNKDSVSSVLKEIREMEQDEQLVEQFRSSEMSVCETFDL